jgi:Putative transmembrane protein (PGPGW)
MKMLGKAHGWIGKALHRWRLLWTLDAGHRFQTRYHTCWFRRECGEAFRYGRTVNLSVGPLLVVAGFLFLPTPGPSFIIVVIGLWMVAGELLVMARLFDRMEVRLRKVARWVKEKVWARSPNAVKVSVVLGAAGAVLYGIYRLSFSG